MMPRILLAMSLVATLHAQSLPLVIAHRGASGYLPEHTLPAKALAHALGADFLEQDLVLTRDNVPVVLHDIHIDTISDVARRHPDRHRSDGRFYAIDFTLEELKQLRLSERFVAKTGRAVFPHRFPVGSGEFRIVTLEEELTFIQGLNHSTSRTAGVYPELKQPAWHRAQGRDLAAVVLPVLEKFGYGDSSAPCYLQCFEYREVQRIRRDLGWKGRMILLIEADSKGEDGTDYDAVCRPEGLKELARWVNGIGPSLSRVLSWSPAGGVKASPLTSDAHAAGLLVHPYTVRRDELPKGCGSLDALHQALFQEARVDGVFTDFPDLTRAWLQQHR
ncbi:MAG: glycerophosphodiester phosphodiesterase [Opitutaceae bacterium]|nr:glycerophosphodiester phosphodiesterase [Opitutaceae bacterium]